MIYSHFEYFKLERKVNYFVATERPAVRSYGFYEALSKVKIQPQKLQKPQKLPEPYHYHQGYFSQSQR